MTKRQTLVVTLRRRSKNQCWGISIAGGADLGSPIIVTRSENDDLQKGDVIKKIDEYDVRDIRHVDALNLLQNSDSIRLVIERSEVTREPMISQFQTPTVMKPVTRIKAAVYSLSEKKH